MSVQKIFQMYGPQYLVHYGDRMPKFHKKAIRDIMKCRKGAFGTMVYECSDCRNLHFVQCCCGNRHCPNCQQSKADQWLNQQMKKTAADPLLPANDYSPKAFGKLSDHTRSYPLGRCFHAAMKH